jgi:hypothetical protein
MGGRCDRSTISKLEAIMGQRWIENRWWEAVTVLLALNSVLFGFLFGSQFGWAIAAGFAPGLLLLVGLRLRPQNRGLATVLIIVSSLAAAAAFWMIYPVVLALVIVIGGFSTGKIGPSRSEIAAV